VGIPVIEQAKILPLVKALQAELGEERAKVVPPRKPHLKSTSTNKIPPRHSGRLADRVPGRIAPTWQGLADVDGQVDRGRAA
jgi:hypothetical protein